MPTKPQPPASTQPASSQGEPLSPLQKAYKQYTAIKENPRHRLVWGLALLCLSILLLYAFGSYIFNTAVADQSLLINSRSGDLSQATYTNATGAVGSIVAHWFIAEHFGWAAFFIPITLLIAGLRLMRYQPIRFWTLFIHCTILTSMLAIVFTSLQVVGAISPLTLRMPFNIGGNLGYNLTRFLHQYLGQWGVLILMVFATLIYLIYVYNTVYQTFAKLLGYNKLVGSPHSATANDQEEEDELYKQEEEEDYDADNKNSEPTSTTLLDTPATLTTSIETEAKPHIQALPANEVIDELGMKITIASGDDDVPDDNTNIPTATSAIDGLAPLDPKHDLSLYRYPSTNLLKKIDNPPIAIDERELAENNQRITDTLSHFKVNIKSIEATIGPTITLYEIMLEDGVRISTVKNLEDDIAMNLQVTGVRIIAPMPGKGTIGIEVPNKHPQVVSMEGLIQSRKFQETKMELPIALGRTTTNDVFMFDLAKAPHLLVAGATGQGKSVGLNAMIASLLFKKHPAELKLVMIDPKRVELSMYAPIQNHFLAKLSTNEGNIIITEVDKAIDTLNSLVQEMENRYMLLEQVNVRNVIEYNNKYKQRLLPPQAGHRFLPYIVVVIDEYGDFIMTVGKEVEMPITRIAQKARAVGIHMIIATQRPDAKIVTGNIKANFPTRVAFRVSSAIDSRTIINDKGAEQLVGRGDLLYLGGEKPVRVQCAFLDTPEVEAVTKFISEQQSFGAPYELPEPESTTPTTDTAHEDRLNGKRDDLFNDCARYVVQNQRASASSLQAAYAIGYNRASRIMLHLEALGIIGPDRGTKPREIFYQDLDTLDTYLSTLS